MILRDADAFSQVIHHAQHALRQRITLADALTQQGKGFVAIHTDAMPFKVAPTQQPLRFCISLFSGFTQCFNCVVTLGQRLFTVESTLCFGIPLINRLV
ncbi:hypothetical protein D3C81_1467590 [compost metagenome]